MSPEHIAGNLWRLFDDELIVGVNGRTIRGDEDPFVRIFEYEEELDRLRIQGATKTIEVEGADFEVVVQTAE